LPLAFLVGVLSLVGPAAHAQEVHVFVSSRPAATPGQSVYRYRVVNNSTQLITTFHLGWDYFNAQYTLNVPPSGWSRENGLAPSSVGSPSNWSAQLLTTEETDVENSLEWGEDDQPFSLLPGQMASGFTVTAPTDAEAYRSGIWTVLFAGPSGTTAALAASRHLELDFRPPSPEDAPQPEPSIAALGLGDSVPALSGAKGSWRYYKVTVPSATPLLQVNLSGGTGDADLYVKQGTLPDPRSPASAPYIYGTNEHAIVPHPNAGDWYIGVHGYDSYGGVSLSVQSDATAILGTGGRDSLSGTAPMKRAPHGPRSR
jgi:hypothetical protein